VIIDCHCHAGRGDGATGPLGEDAPLERYLLRAGAAGIAKTVLLGTFVKNYDNANAYVARLSMRYPGRFIPFAIVHPLRDKGRIYDMVDRSVGKWQFKGIKVHKHDGPATPEVCEAARAFRLPVLYDVMGATELLDNLVPRYPDVNFIVPHIGSFADDWRAQQRLISQMEDYPNLYTDTAGVRRFDHILQALSKVGATRVLFGTDGPWLHPGLELHKIRLLNLSPGDESLILGQNLLRLTSGSCVSSDLNLAS
jgi:uncharacterized protein